MCTIKVRCNSCNREFEMLVKSYNMNKRLGRNNYCSRECFNEYRAKNTIINVNCCICGKNLKRYKRSESKDDKYYCKDCRGMVNVQCVTCGKEIIRTKHDVRKYKELYCSNECRSLAMRKEWNELSRSIWIRVFGIGSLVCKRCGHNKTYNIQLHHKQYVCNGGNNEPDNLEPLCRNCHATEHYEHGEDKDE